MKTTNARLKIKIEPHMIDDYDPEEISRWENEGGLPSIESFSLPTPALPLHKKEIFEVLDCKLIIENGELYLLTEIDVLSHH